MKNFSQPIKQFLSSPAFAVIGASTNREKYGNKVLRCYMQHHMIAFPVNPHEKMIEGVLCYPDIKSLTQEVNSISIITPPAITEQIVEDAIDRGIQNIWMQPGAESEEAIRKCRAANINVIADGSCILVVLGFSNI